MAEPIRMVKCKYCNIQFNRNAEPAVEVGGRRWAHKACHEKYESSISQEEKDYLELEKYIKKLFDTNIVSAKIKKQIRDFREEYNYTYSGMLKTLYWWYEIKGHTTELAQKGIGIIPFIYDDASQYYYSIYLAKIVNDAKSNYRPPIKEIEIAPPRVKTNQVKFFKFKDDE